MSFQDLEAGTAGSPTPTSRFLSLSVSESREDAAFNAAQSSMAMLIFKIQQNVVGIMKLVNDLGTVNDDVKMRKKLHDLTESTREMAKRGSKVIKELSELPSNSPQQKAVFQKTSDDFHVALKAFQNAQQVSAKRQKTVVQTVKLAVDEERQHSTDSPLSSQEQRQVQIMQAQLSPHELAYQESIIQEREEEIRLIEMGIHELSDIFRGLGTFVAQQGGMLDNIETNISSVVADVGAASEQLTTAAHYQRKAGRRAACLMIVLAIVLAIVLLAILS